MSDSRLEKFIYAICSMDVSDLPVPLSRIETLWNCLITGETPDFEPLSRNEKYLMAMLDRYDISNLPAPMSRGEKLLYKIAVGETDLSDVPGYLSRYEELLKYLIENGEISEDDFEYVLYTLNQSLYTLYTTAEKPVKSAILKGQTLVNLANLFSFDDDVTTSSYFIDKTVCETSKLQVNKPYLICFKPTVKENLNTGNYVHLQLGLGNSKDMTEAHPTVEGNSHTCNINHNEWNFIKITFKDFLGYQYLTVRPLRTDSPSDDKPITYNVNEGFMLLEYQQDMENWDIPFFRGMQSVKMPVLTTTGKNIFSPTKMNINDGALYGYYKVKDDESVKYTLSLTDKDPSIKLGEVYFGASKVGKTEDGGLNWLISNGVVAFPTTSSITTNLNFISIYPNNIETLNKITKRFNIQIEFSEEKTTYEPYKTNILTVNEDVELRGIGDVRDELNVATGELTQHIGEIVLDGSEEWTPYPGYVGEGNSSFVATITSLNNKHNDNVNNVINDKFISGSWFDYANNQNLEIMWSNNPNQIGIRVKSEKASDVDGFKAFLSANNIKINYELATPVVKTVDLTVVDQDNQPTELGTFENVTHVSLVAENLIPEVEMEVATRISTELASASTLMDDISNEQQQLETTVDEQSENVDATMIATTEIFEETL